MLLTEWKGRPLTNFFDPELNHRRDHEEQREEMQWSLDLFKPRRGALDVRRALSRNTGENPSRNPCFISELGLGHLRLNML